MAFTATNPPAHRAELPDAAPPPDPQCEALWTACLAVSQARRGGQVAPPAAAGLRWAGAEGWVLDGAWDDPAHGLFRQVKPLLDRPAGGDAWVIAQLGQSLDGCVATRTGDSYFVNGPHNLVHVHRLRALCDAVIVGAGTVAADNPRLTTRRVAGPDPVRVILDPAARLPVKERAFGVFRDVLAPTLWLCDERHAARAESLLAAPPVTSARVLAVAGLLRGDGTLHLAAAVAALRARGLQVLFVEGGGVTVSRFLAEGCLDRLHVAVAPVIIGDGRPGLRFAGPARLADCLRPGCSVHAMGCDQLWDLDLRSPAASS